MQQWMCPCAVCRRFMDMPHHRRFSRENPAQFLRQREEYNREMHAANTRQTGSNILQESAFFCLNPGRLFKHSVVHLYIVVHGLDRAHDVGDDILLFLSRKHASPMHLRVRCPKL